MTKAIDNTNNTNTSAKASKPAGKAGAKAKPAKAKPSAPAKGGKVAPKAKAPKGGPKRPKVSKPKVAAKAPKGAKAKAEKPDTPSVDTAALLKEIKSLKAEVAKQNEVIAKAAAKASRLPKNARHVDQILDGITVADDDWREEYHGHRMNVYAFNASAKGEFTVDEGTELPAMLAIPRDSDVGGKGPAMRRMGMVALHWQPLEELDADGNPVAYSGKPGYCTHDELHAIWPE